MSISKEFSIPNWKRLLPLLVAAAGIIAYANSFHGSFVLDDYIRIAADRNIRQFSISMLHSTRPLVGLTLYLNYVVGKFIPADYHVVNLAIHIIAGLLLFGIVRRTLGEIRGQTLYTGSVPRWTTGSVPAGLAVAVAAIWVVHPLQTESVTYIIQRAESLMGMFYLLTLYCVIRGIHSPKPHRWYTAAIVSCALGMTSKPVMVTAPLMVLLYDRFFISKSFIKALRERWFLYIGLAATWIILIALLSTPHESSTSAGFSAGLISPVRYLLTQQGVILHYLKLAFWPRSLCLDYGWPPTSTLKEVLIPGLFVVSLLLLTLWASMRRNPLGYIGLWFFLILAPSSSIIPVADYAVEHRMYLPLAGVIMLAVISVHEFLGYGRQGYGGLTLSSGSVPHIPLLRGCAGTVLLTAILAVLTVLTITRNKDYRSVRAISRDIVEKRPDNFRAHTALIYGLLAEGKFIEAELIARRLLERISFAQRSGDFRYTVGTSNAAYFYPVAHNQLGRALLCQGKSEEAIKHFSELVRVRPDKKFAYNNLGLAFFQQGRVDDAVREWNKALAIDPEYARTHALLGIAAAERGEFGHAIENFRKALKTAPDFLFAKCELAWVLATCQEKSLRDGTSAVELATSVCKATDYRSFRALDVLAAAYAETGRFDQAARAAQKALKLALGDRPYIQGLSPYTSGNMDSSVTAIRHRLHLYRKGAPFRDET